MTDTSISAGLATDTSASTGWSAKTWLAMLGMLATSFALVSAEFLPAGLLTPMARDLGISEGMAGQVVTVTAMVGALAALFSNVLIGRINRKTVLVGLSALAIASNLLATFATDFWVLLIGRAGLGIALSAFWALSVAVVARLVGTGAIGRGTAMVSLGVSLATIAAPSMGALIGDWLGWRSAMGLTAALSGLALILQLVGLPSMPASAGNSMGDMVRLLKRRGVQLGMLAIILLMAGHMTGSVYVRPFLEQVTGLETGMIALVLAGFGAAAVLGTIAGGKLADIDASRALATTGGIMALAALALVLWGNQIAAAFTFAALWGFAFGMAPVALQANLSRSATDALESSGSLMVVSFQVAIMTGALVGGYIVDTYSAVANLMVTALLAGLTLVLALVQPKPKR
ncbi:MFS transporter [Devosia sp.]|uniref:MFS transporter n=1 Tax=Devosia sp. TaxID=1871048 RepID=UPI0025E57ED7|nr:MFS transporter [Devosia sp.]MCR6636769.1 MFS transporter [Devosia sp.]